MLSLPCVIPNVNCEQNLIPHLSSMKTDAYNYATGLCSRKEYCASEITDKLLRRGFTPDEAAATIERLEAERYINAERYARAFVSDKFRFSHWGRIKIKYALRMKGIDDQLIETALAEAIDATEYEQVRQAFIADRMVKTKGRTPYEIRQKVMRAALARGFEVSD